MSGKTQPSTHLFLLFSLLILLPLSATTFVACELINSLAGYSRIETLEKLSEQTESVGASAHSEAFFRPIFNNYVRRAFELAESDIVHLESLGQEFNQQAGVIIDNFAFDSNGKLVPNRFTPGDMHEAAQFLWEYLNQESAELSFEKMKPALIKIFGREFHPRKLKKMRNQIFSFVAGNKPGMILYSRKREADQEGMRGIILLARNLPNHTDILNKSLTNFKNSEISLGIVIEGQSPEISATSSESQAMLARINGLMIASQKDELIHGNWLWKKNRFNEFSVIAGTRLNNDQFSLFRNLTLVFALFIALSCGAVAFKNFRATSRVWISIRLKLIILFIFAVYLPLLGLFFLSFKGLNDRKIVLENEARKGMLDLLYQIDSDFSIKESEMKATFDRLFLDHTWQEKLGQNWEMNKETLLQHSGLANSSINFFNWLEIRNARLEQLFCTSRGEANTRVKDLNRVMAQICLEKFVPQLLTPEAKKIRQSDFIIRNIIENPVLGFSHYFEVPGQIVPMEFEGSFLYWYWNYYKNPVGDVVFFSGNTQAQANALSYLEKALAGRFSFGNIQLKVISFLPSEQKWLPQGQKIEARVDKLNRITAINQKITTSRIEIDGKHFLATCFPGIKVRNVLLTCLYPVDEIEAKIAMMRRQIFQGMILIVVVAILTGLLLTRNFLKPISELNTGLNALRLRQTEFRVNINSNDEFGSLGETFNQMMIEVKEMLLAGAVQQCLIPTNPPQIPGYDLLIFNQMATDVGGDYADAFILPDNKFLLVLGDVTGHGVSSSILTAMVKAMIFRFSQNPTELTQLMKDLSHMIFDLLRHRKLMTFCAIIVDQGTGNFWLSNAGHPFPFICDRDGKHSMIKHNSLPLGVSKKRSTYQVSTGHLQRGDLMILYTDGIAEGADEAGNIFGFDRLGQIVSRNCKESVETLKENLLQEFWQHYTKEHLDDDLTFIILKRQSPENLV